MLAELIRKEILSHLISMRFAIACVLCLFVMLTSFAVRTTEYAQVLDDYHKDSLTDRTEVQRMDEPWRLVWGVYRVYQAPNPLKIFVRGVEARNGGAARLISSEPAQFVQPDVQNTSVPLFPPMDLVAFVGVVLSLMAIIFGFDAVCGEKQRGTLRLMLSYSVPRDVVLLSKWIGGYVMLILPYLLAVIVMLVIVLVYKGVALSGADWIKLIAIIGASLIYLAAVFSMALWVSCLCGRAQTSIMVLSAVWVIVFLAVPNLSPHVARLIKPTRTPQVVTDQRIEVTRDIWEREVEQKMEAYDKEHGFSKQWWKDINWNAWSGRKRAAIRRVQRYTYSRDAHLMCLREFDKIDEQSTGELNEQIRLSQWLSRISPFACFSLVAAELADEGVREKRRFLAQVRDFQKILVRYSHDEVLHRQQYEIDHEGKDLGPWTDTRREPLPRFHYVPAAGMEYVQTIAVDTGILAGLVIVFFMLAYARFLRYDVR